MNMLTIVLKGIWETLLFIVPRLISEDVAITILDEYDESDILYGVPCFDFDMICSMQDIERGGTV